MTYMYKTGAGHVGSYMISAVPYASSSLAVPESSSAPLVISFPQLTKWVTIKNTLSTSDTSSPFRVGFSALGVSGSGTNYFTLDNGESYTGEWRVYKIFLIGQAAASSGSVVAGITGVPTSSLAEPIHDNWTGSVGVG